MRTVILTGEASSPLLFRHVTPGSGDFTLQFRLIHFWDARKNVKGRPAIILGIELLMIDAEGTVAQGFIGQNRRNQYEKELRRGRIYTLTNFYASNSKVMYHVADQRPSASESIPLHDVVGHLKLVEGQTLHQRPVLCTKDDSTSRKVMVHLLLKDGTVINVYLWDEAAENFRMKFDACAVTPTVLLVTTVNPKRFGGKLCLCSMSSSRVFLDEEVDPTKEYLTWLSTNPSATSSVNPVEVVKYETLTISEIAAFIKRQPAKLLTNFGILPTLTALPPLMMSSLATMLCPKCGNENATAGANYRVEMFVYDNEEQCTFIILGNAGKDLTGRKATELIDMLRYENGGDGAELEIPLPQCFIDTIGQTKKFRIKVAHYNFTSTRLSLTATKIVSSAVLPPKNPPLKTPPGNEVEMSELAESSGGGTSASDDKKKAKRAKLSG
ncbi:hypothetical protein HID58_054302 [Brassica napus]|uniref:Replication factor A C-terminal domain-containing protein n=1 Tax=Brassica napus TaxID=3708 RepID=A0ABQ8AHE5_BRANA|nr:hypothetical protein HID58_054302 [Brassica napus]